MKIERTKTKPTFQPFSITIQVESEEEREMLNTMALFNHTIPGMLSEDSVLLCNKEEGGVGFSRDTVVLFLDRLREVL
tara:strand:+ start:20191 stop:20424 length:234 start_codon:yes stop_codon:yes gene_type:complete